MTKKSIDRTARRGREIIKEKEKYEKQHLPGGSEESHEKTSVSISGLRSEL
jgi:hypothetical protein